ncbi:hypothetical protein V8G54_017702 [Vigna mungo]|uniref:Legume lectin domain-containing protein n=1 Tax=Vigna mungo TaxID=3915 RepID=A0AAQ3S0I6_VIGMU
MAFPNSKSLSPLSILLIKFLVPFLLLLQHHSAQPSPLSAYETISFGFSFFEEDDINIGLLGNASISGGVLRLTNTDQLGKPVPHSVGRAVHITPIHLWDKSNGNLADFSSGFSFVVNPNGSTLHADGFAFFLAPADLHLPRNSSGAYLGLFNPETALDPSKNQIPNSPSQSPHIGIDVDSIKSVATVAWPSELEPDNAVAHASINYNSESKHLSVFVAYPGDNRNATVSTTVDLRTVLPEWIRVGFSAATGDLVETHDVLNWVFEAAL